MVIQWKSGVYGELPHYFGPLGYQYNILEISAIWTYDPVTGDITVTVTGPGTYTNNFGKLGGGGSAYLRRR